jgi:hypothetical protein
LESAARQKKNGTKNSEQVAIAHLIEWFTCRLYDLKFRGLNLLHGRRKKGRKSSEQVAIAHLIERFNCRLYGLKLRGLNLPQGSGKMKEIQSKWQ